MRTTGLAEGPTSFALFLETCDPGGKELIKETTSPGSCPGYLDDVFEQVGKEIGRKYSLNDARKLPLGVGFTAFLFLLPDEEKCNQVESV